jgi:UV DNA damage endonuclease
MNIGYCCINLTLGEQKIYTNRSMIKRTFEAKGLEYAGELGLKNITDLLTILKWNNDNGIKVFRMSSSLFPWMTEYKFKDLPQYKQIRAQMRAIGQYVMDNDIRVGFHPGQYNVLPSPRQNVVENSIHDLNLHAEMLDMMGLPSNHYYSINIHVGGSYGDKVATLKRFCKNYKRLSASARRRLVIENDDKATQYGVQDLYDGLHQVVGVPITFDFFHHTLCTNDMSSDDAAKLAASTWDCKPLAHYSSSRKIYEDKSVPALSHADYIHEQIPAIGKLFDIELEAKAKELALLKYQKQFSEQFSLQVNS